jgi:hypothetical protein
MEKGIRKGDAPTIDEVPRIVGASPCGCPGTINALERLIHRKNLCGFRLSIIAAAS